MENNLFRKKSLERISSPEELHDYMRVTGPRLWMLLGAILALLAGFVVYASTVTMENTVRIPVRVETFETTQEYQAQGGSPRYSLVSSTLPNSMRDTLKPGMVLRLGDATGKLDLISTVAEEEESSLVFEMDNDYVALPDGTYEAELVLESTTPISFLWN